MNLCIAVRTVLYLVAGLTLLAIVWALAIGLLYLLDNVLGFSIWTFPVAFFVWFVGSIAYSVAEEHCAREP